MKYFKFILLAIVAISMMACGEDNETRPANPIDINNPVDKDSGNDTGFSETHQLNSMSVETHFITGNIDCNNEQAHKGRLTQQQRARIFNRLCRQAARRAERRLNRRCNRMVGQLENVQLNTNTYRERFGYCRSLNCEVRGTGTCGVN